MIRRAEIVTEAELEARAAELAIVPESDDETRGEQTGLLIVRFGGERFGIEVAWVREVIAEPVVTPLPMAPALVAGVINLRGEILGALDLCVLFGLPAAEAGRRFAVVVQQDDLGAAILAEGVDEVAWFRAGAPFDFAQGRQPVTTLNLSELLNHPQLKETAAP